MNQMVRRCDNDVAFPVFVKGDHYISAGIGQQYPRAVQLDFFKIVRLFQVERNFPASFQNGSFYLFVFSCRFDAGEVGP